MKEFDFDELDRAVNSQLTGNGAAGPVDDEVVIAQPEQVQPQPTTQPLATRRSSGRFMDVVHPSSDMRTKTVPARHIAREGLNIPPSRSTTFEPDVSYQPLQPAVSDWPDPLDFKPSNPSITPTTTIEASQNVKPATETEEDIDIDQIAESINKTFRQDQDAIAPLESPFLADAKVDKRPLGAFSGEAGPAVEPSPMANWAPDPDMPTSTSEDNPVSSEESLPAELQDDLLLIESGVEVTEKTKLDEQTAPVDAPSGPTSIPQQYTEQPRTDDKPTAAIFDTDDYHKPLSHPAKKKSGWWLVLWIALLLVVGAGAGAAVFFFVLPK